ncbi:MAG: hypothetical protein PWQ17_1115 [Anaerophaga sp.]|nr:hypothetical protein [Anaerophaga sp.]
MPEYLKKKKNSRYISRTSALKAVILLSLLTGTQSSARSTIIGNPPVYHFSHTDYNSDSQFWAACQDSSGVMYFGNNYGVLRFDGERWDKTTMPNNSSVRSLYCATNGTVYAGGFNEFGIIKNNADGSFSYHSLIGNLPSRYRDFGNVWNIMEKNGTIIFQSFDYLCLLNNNNYEIIEPSDYFGFAGECKNHIFVLDNMLLTLDVSTSQFTPFISNDLLNNEEILNIIPGNETSNVLIFTKEGSLYVVDINTKAILKRDNLSLRSSGQVFTSVLRSSSGTIYTGTLSKKLSSWQYKDSQLRYIRTFSDLQDHTVLNIFEAREGIIWTLLNKGLDFFDPNAHLTSVFQGSSIYDVVLYKNRLYIATNQGVFRTNQPISDNIIHLSEFEKLPSLEGQAWSLKIIEGELFCSHDRGLFHISGNQVKKVGDFSGVWKLYPTSQAENQYFVCTYTGLGLISVTTPNVMVLQEKIKGFDESTRDLMAIPGDRHSYWVCHGYKGVFRIKINDSNSRVISTEHFNEQNGLPSSFNINVHRWRGKNIFSTNHGLYTFDSITEQFVVHKELTNILGDEKNIRQLVEHGDTTWCVIDDQIAFIDHKQEDKVITDPFLSLKGTLNRGMECIVPLKGSNEVLIGTTNGLFAYNPVSTKNGSPDNLPKTQIQIVTFSMKDSTATRRPDAFESPIVIPNDAYNISFRFSAPFIRDKANIRYAYLLEERMDNWSQWQEKPEVSFSFLKSGDYTLKVKAKSLSGEYALPAQISFTVEPVWYATMPWVIFWSALAFALAFSIFKRIQKIILKEKEKTRQEEKELQKAREIERENQIIMHEKERIEAENIEKSKDLANNAMLIAKKRELLIDIQSKLNNIRKNAKNDIVRKNILDIVRNIQISLNDEKQYQLFDINLERVHQELFDELKKRYPSITIKELRMCAFIKMELTNKEMASIFNISVRGVETARYRLKKKYPNIHELIGQP